MAGNTPTQSKVLKRREGKENSYRIPWNKCATTPKKVSSYLSVSNIENGTAYDGVNSEDGIALEEE